MTIRGMCAGCRKKKFFIRYRIYTAKHINTPMKSNNKLCGGCFRSIKKMIEKHG